LTEWITGKRNPVAFWRTAGSGSQFTVKKGKSPMCGDIIAVDPKGEPLTNLFCIECRHRKTLRTFYAPLLKKNKSTIFINMWLELKHISQVANKHPLFIFRENYHPIMVAMESSMFDILFRKKKPDMLWKLEIYGDYEEAIVCFPLSAMFECITIDDIKRVLKTKHAKQI
jgi:hypothetical protein